MKTLKNKQKITFKILTGVFIIAISALFVSCEGEMGPVGPAGEDGVNIIGSVYEVEVDFTAENEYSVIVTHPSSIEVLQDDVVLVYILWEVDNGTDIWRLCPQTVVLEDGVIQYNYHYTQSDARLFLEFTVEESSLLPAETENQIFRVAILPTDFYGTLKSADISDFNSLLQMPDLELKVFDEVEINSIPEIK